MELARCRIRRNKEREKGISQAAFDQDFNIPDAKADVKQLAMSRARAGIKNIKTTEETVEISGVIDLAVLYTPAGEGNGLEVFSGEIPFTEKIHMNELSENDFVTVSCELEDLTVSLINSRKLRVSALVDFVAEADGLYDEEAAESIKNAGDDVDSLYQEQEMLLLAAQKKDSIRIREEAEIGKNKPNIQRVLWEDISLLGMEYKLMDGSLELRGDLSVFLIYQSEEEQLPIQWVEKTLPFHAEMELKEGSFSMVPDIFMNLSEVSLSVKPDYDGENREILVEGVIDLSIELYEEKTITLLKDAYSSKENLKLSEKKTLVPELLIKNNGKTKLSDRIAIDARERLLQICHCGGVIRMDSAVAGEDGLTIEGSVGVSLVYLAAEDETPIKMIKKEIPYTYVCEAKGIHDKAKIHIHSQIEQLSAMMIGNNEVEIRAVLGFDVLVMDEKEITVINGLETEPFDETIMNEMPAITGYIVKEGDTLWSVAKKYYTTVEKIKKQNELSSDLIHPGDKLLIGKRTEKLFE